MNKQSKFRGWILGFAILVAPLAAQADGNALKREIDGLKREHGEAAEKIKDLRRQCPAGCTEATDAESRKRQGALHGLQAREIYTRYTIALDEAEIRGGHAEREREHRRQCPECEQAVQQSREVLLQVREMQARREGGKAPALAANVLNKGQLSDSVVTGTVAGTSACGTIAGGAL